MTPDSDESGTTIAPVKVGPIAAIALCGHALSLTISVLVARRLGLEQFEAYAVSASVFLIMVSIAPLGLDKYSVRILPVLLERTDLSRAYGFCRFGLGAVLVSGMVIGSGVGLTVWWTGLLDAATTAAVIAGCMALPAGALAHFGIEVSTALGGERRATAVLRLTVPMLALCIFGVMILMRGDVGAAWAIAAWGIAWMCAIAILALDIRQLMPAGVWSSTPQFEARAWIPAALPFLAYRGVLAFLLQSSILLLSAMDVAPAAVGAYAVALAITTPVVALFTATNRAYGRRLSISLERQDYDAIYEIRKARLRWLLPMLSLMLVISLFFPYQLVGMFGFTGSDDAVASLRILALASAFTMTFSLAPTYIKFTRAHSFTLTAAAIAVVVQSVLLIVLAPRLGATGAASAHAIALIGMYGAFALVAWRDLLRKRSGAKRSLARPPSK